MRKLSVSTLVSLDGVIQDPGGFGETENGGWANAYFTDYAQRESLRHLQASEYFLIGRRTYELLHAAWGGIKGGAYLDRMNEIPKLVASTTLRGALEWNATVIDGDVPTAITTLKQEGGGDIEVYGSATLVQTLMRHDLIDEYRVAVHPPRPRPRHLAVHPARRRHHPRTCRRQNPRLRRSQPDLCPARPRPIPLTDARVADW